MKNALIAFSCILLSSIHGHSQVMQKVTKADSIYVLLDNTIKQNNLPGLSLTIIKDGEIHNYTSGLSDVESKTPLKNSNTFFSGSIGKTYAAALIFQLIDAQKIRLEDTFISFFPEKEWLKNLANINAITIEMLLQHTSGLPRYVLKPEIWETLHKNPDKIWTYKERLSVIFNDPAVHEAGKSWAYSDTNYILLGMLIEQITGKEYYNLVIENILKAHNLTETHPSLTRQIPNLSIGYSKMPPSFHIPNKTVNDEGFYCFNPQFEWTGGGMASSTSDLAKWAKLYFEGHLFSKASLELVTTVNPNGSKVMGTNSYGMGGFIFNTKHGIAYGHSGFMPGFNSLCMYYPELKIAAALQFNCDYASAVLNMNSLIDQLVSKSITN